ncbi:MAG TPA: nuclear transport factor 2 family protein [Rhodanobacter sp.]|jgi:ketosteroid isomerase-like protein|nr:nuclear transport factor 2 family protein [Rhodanobacter sp.]
MKAILTLSCLALAAPGHAGSLPAAHAMLPPALANAVAAFDKAQVGSDGAALGRLLADDYVLFNSHGEHEDKRDFIRDYTSPDFKLLPFEVRDEVVRVWPGGAVLSGTATLQGRSEGKQFKATMHFADVWRLKAGKWQVVFTEARRLP